MARRTLLLDVDATLLIDTVDPVLEYASYKGSGDYSGTPVPAGARELEITDPHGRDRSVFVLESALDALRTQAAAGVDIVWHSNWLAAPAQLESLAQNISLDSVVRFPLEKELAAPVEFPDPYRPRPPFWDDWRVRTIIARAATLASGDDLVVASVDIDLSVSSVAEGIRRRSGNPSPLLGSIPTTRMSGLDAAALATWTPTREHVGTWHRRP